ncbi:hypothetical protein GmHk_02G004569 [Glycine max]|nr:hypothetical protein GmHk_02G004569 [Glycine max]
MSEIEEVQEQMKADMEAMKDKMTIMMQAMMSIRKMMEVNTTTVVATSTATEVDPTYPSSLNQVNPPVSDMVGKLGANGKNKKEGGTHAMTAIPTWPNFPLAPQYQYSANISPSHYPPPYQPRTPNHPQRPPLNRPQNPPVVHAIPNTSLNTNQNTNQGRNFPKKKPVEFTPIPVSYANLLPYLLNNAMVAIIPTKVPQPPFS